MTQEEKAVSAEVLLMEAERQIDELKLILEHERKIHLKIAIKAERMHAQLMQALAACDVPDVTPEDMTGMEERE